MDQTDLAACIFARLCANRVAPGVVPEPIQPDTPRAYLRLEAARPPVGTIEQRRIATAAWARCAQLVVARHAAAAALGHHRPEWVPPVESTRAAALRALEATAAAAAATDYFFRWADAPAETPEQRQYVAAWASAADERQRADVAAVGLLWEQAQQEAAARIAAALDIEKRRAETDPIWAQHTARVDALYAPAPPSKAVLRSEAAEATLAALRERTERAAEAAADRVRQRAARRIAAAEGRAEKARRARIEHDTQQDEARHAAVLAERQRVAAELAPNLLAWRIDATTIAVEDFDGAGRRAVVITACAAMFPHAATDVHPLDASLVVIRGGFCGIDAPGHDAPWVGKTLGEIVTP